MAGAALAYRPFVSTDAAVADRLECLRGRGRPAEADVGNLGPGKPSG